MKKLLILLACLTPLLTWSIDPPNWIALTKGGIINGNLCVEADSDGNAYIVSGFDPNSEHYVFGNDQQVDANLSKYGDGYTNLLITKYDQQGHIQWSVPIEGKQTVYAWSSHFGKDGCLYVGGNFRYDAIFHSTDGDSVKVNYQTMPSYPRQFHRFFIAKYSKDGKLLWIRTGNSHDNMGCFGIKTDDLGNAYAWIYSPSNTMSIGDFSVFPSSNSDHYIERHYATIVKYTRTGDEDWLFLSGDYFDPIDFWIDEENRVRVLGNVGASKMYAHTTAGASFSLKYDIERKEILELTLNDKGEIVSNKYVIEDLQTGYARSMTYTKDGYVFGFVSGQFENRKKGIAIANDSLFDQTRESDLFFIAINDKGKVRWMHHVGGTTHDKTTDMLPLKNGRVLIAARLTQNPCVYDRNNKVIQKLNNDDAKGYHLFDLDRKGKIKSISSVGNEHYRGFEGGLHLAGNEEHLYLSTNYSAPCSVFGKKLSPENDSLTHQFTSATESALIHLENLNPTDVTLYHSGSVQINVDELNQRMIKAKKALNQTISSVVERVDSSFLKTMVRDNEVFVFPNPVSGQDAKVTVRLNLHSVSAIKMELYNLKGEQMQKMQFGNQSGMQDLTFLFKSGLTPGLYLLRIFIGDELITQKIVVN